MIESPNGADDLIEPSYTIFRQVQRMQVAGKVVEAKSPTGTNETTSSNVRLLRDERALLRRDLRSLITLNRRQTFKVPAGRTFSFSFGLPPYGVAIVYQF